MIKTTIRLFINRARQISRSSFTRYGGAPARLAYRLLSPAYSREMNAVFKGIGAYYKTESETGHRHKVRRHVHMLEKGLSMRPRRASFAADYIQETVTDYAKLLRSGPLSTIEGDWFHDVLAAYFEATISSENPRIRAAQLAFDSMALIPRGTECVPRPVGAISHLVDIEALTELAHQRTSVRWYTDQTVSRNVIDKAVDIAMQAPTACNRVPWKLRIFDTTPEVEQIASIAMGTTGFASQLPGIAVLVGDLSAYVNEHDRHLIYIDGSLAAMSFVLGLQAQGVSSCCINWPDVKVRENAMAKQLGLRPWERVIMLVAYGHADESGLTPFSAKVELDTVRSYG